LPFKSKIRYISPKKFLLTQQNRDEAGKCRLEDSTGQKKDFLVDKQLDGGTFPELLIEDGGPTLEDYLDKCGRPGGWKRLKYTSFVTAFREVFLGLALLARKNHQHLDIKSNNVLYNAETNRMWIGSDRVSTRTYPNGLIDFGLLSSADQIFQDNSLYILNHPTVYHPPEFTLFGFIRMHRDKKLTRPQLMTAAMINLRMSTSNRSTLEKELAYVRGPDQTTNRNERPDSYVISVAE
jgi:serine/threonine protein kinase